VASEEITVLHRDFKFSIGSFRFVMPNGILMVSSSQANTTLQ